MVSSQRKTWSWLWGLLGLLALGAGSGCTPLGNYYQRVTTIPPGTALVYVYRPSSFIGGAVEFEVKANGHPVGVLPNGGYFYFTGPPGITQLTARTESTASVVLNLIPGQVHFVRGGIGLGAFVGRPHLEVVPNPIAEPEIAGCRLALPAGR